MNIFLWKEQTWWNLYVWMRLLLFLVGVVMVVVEESLSHNASIICIPLCVPIFGIVIYATRIHKNGKTSALSCVDWLEIFILILATFCSFYIWNRKFIIIIDSPQGMMTTMMMAYLPNAHATHQATVMYTANLKKKKSMGKHFLDLSHPLFFHQPLLLLFSFSLNYVRALCCFFPFRLSEDDMKDEEENVVSHRIFVVKSLSISFYLF